MDVSVNTATPLSWRTPISSLIRDDFVLPDEYATNHATLEDAASHRTGMPRHDGSYGGPGSILRDVVRNFRYLPMTTEIRTTWQYCNMMFIMLSHVIETLTQQWMGDVLRERIWNPLNMTRTYFSLTHAKLAVEDREADLAKGYWYDNSTGKYEEMEWIDLSTVSGAGAVISNVLDYAEWLHFLITKGPLLSAAQHEELRTPRINIKDNEFPSFTGQHSYALGWDISNYRGEPLIAHDGGLPGFGATIGYLPNRGFGWAMMGNTDLTSNVVCLTLMRRLVDDYLGVPEEKRSDMIPFVEEFLGQKTEKARHPRKYLYPTAPNGTDALPLSRPLEAYTGTYENAGYRNITLNLTSSEVSTTNMHSRLQSPLGHPLAEPAQYLTTKLDRAVPVVVTFEHVSGEFFIVRVSMDTLSGNQSVDDLVRVETSKAEFRIGEDGQVSELGVRLEPMMGDEKIWFRRVK